MIHYPALTQLAAEPTAAGAEARRALIVLDTVERGWTVEEAERLYLDALVLDLIGT